MRTIKFRAKNGLDKWVYGSLVSGQSDNGTDVCFIAESLPVGTDDFEHWNLPMQRVKPETVGQFTGWKPRKCSELYEGDIIGFDDWAFTERQRKKMKHHIGVIKWSDEYGNFRIHCNGDGIYEGNDVADPQLLGNIYDNPELVKE